MPANELFDITLTAPDGSNQILITPDTTLNTLTLTITNITNDTVQFLQYTGPDFSIGELPASNSAVYLLFNGLLSDSIITNIRITADGWTAQQTSDSRNGAYWVLLPSANVWLNGGDSLSFTLQFPAVTGSAESGYFSCEYVNVADPALESGGEQLYVELVYPPRTTASATADFPVEFEFVGGNIVYNDGHEHALTFRITNTSNAPLIPGGSADWGNVTPTFTLQFIQDDNSMAGSLLTNAIAAQVNVNVLQQYGNTLTATHPKSSSQQTWPIIQDNTLSNRNGTMLGTGASASVTFSVSRLVTAVPDSVTMAILTYQGFPGYEDGQLTAEICVQTRQDGPSIAAFYSNLQSINISNVSLIRPTLNFQLLNTTVVELYRNGNRVFYQENPGNSAYAVQEEIATTTTFQLVAMDDQGRKAASVLTVQVDTVPLKTVMMWFGTQGDIPAGWKICDGNNGTPNLLDRFVVAASVDDQTNGRHWLGQTGGGGTHSHPLTIPSVQVDITGGGHGHTIDLHVKNIDDGGSNNNQRYYYYGSNSTMKTDGSNDGAHTHGGTTRTASTTTSPATAELPPFYALYYIMKYE